MAAAYAAVVSLLNAVGRINNHLSNYKSFKELEDGYGLEYAEKARRFVKSINSCREYASDLGEMGSFLKGFLETYSHGDSEEGHRLERRIVYFAREAEDAIENRVAYDLDRRLVYFARKSEGAKENRVTSHIIYGPVPPYQDLYGVMSMIEDIKQEAVRIQGLSKSRDQQSPKYSMSLSSSSIAPVITDHESAMVGFEDELLEIMERLIRGDSSRQVISIVGMGGIGKTKLARSVYENRLIVHHFDIQIWITISQECTLWGLLLQIPVCQKELDNNEGLVADNRLGEVLYKFLSGRRYLMVLDDMWNIDVWNTIKLFLPNNDSMSRIIVTTRLSNIATHFGSPILKMSFLDEGNSWKLFCKVVFGQYVDCPLEFENIGKDIAKKCKGPPLSILMVGGLLMKFGRIKEYWESVANDINSFLNSGDDEQHCQNLLLLSYDHLPVHLKPCFLYMGIFPEEQEIRVSQIINLWIAEGFIKLDDNNHKSWEEIAEDCLKDLVDRNLILICSRGLNGKMKTCYIHDLLRDLCLKISNKEKFIRVLRNPAIPQGFLSECGIAFHGHLSQPLHQSRKSLRIFNAADVNSFEFVLHHFNLRYIGCRLTSVRSIPPSISYLWNLQTMICNNIFLVTAPVEIWKMKQLRHFEFNEICLPNPHLRGLVRHSLRMQIPKELDENLHAKELADYTCLKRVAKGLDGYAWPNIRTVTTLVNFKCTREVLVIFQPIKKLKIKYEDFEGKHDRIGADFCLWNLIGFSMLESLKVSLYVKQSMKTDLQGCLTYPSSLKKLTLDNIELCWEDLTPISTLPNLEDLKLMGSIAGTTWTPIEGGFCSLKSLRIFAYIDLIHWDADSSHFPILEIINLGGVPYLKEIPSDIGNIPTLEVIQFCSCRAPTAISAMKILVEQESYDNEDLQVRVTLMNAMEERSFQAIVESESLESNNFIIETGI